MITDCRAEAFGQFEKSGESVFEMQLHVGWGWRRGGAPSRYDVGWLPEGKARKKSRLQVTEMGDLRRPAQAQTEAQRESSMMPRKDEGQPRRRRWERLWQR